MELRVRTGSSKAPRDVALLSLHLTSLRGEQVFVLLEVTGRERETTTVERECEAVVRHALLDTEGVASERLDGALKELNGLIKGMLVSGAVHDLHMLLGIVDAGGTLHVSHAGRSEAYLVRRGTASQITEYGGGRTIPGFVHIASGQLTAQDLVIFSTQRLLRTLTPAQLARLAGGNRDNVLDTLVRALEAESEHAALATLDVVSAPVEEEGAPPRRTARARTAGVGGVVQGLLARVRVPATGRTGEGKQGRQEEQRAGRRAAGGGIGARVSVFLNMLMRQVRARIALLRADLRDPARKKRAHLMLLASSIGLVIVVWASVQLFTGAQRSKTRAELETLVELITADIQTAETRRIMGGTDEANAILARAEERARQVMDSESGLFRVEANQLLSTIRAKHEEINNVVRVQPRQPVADFTTVKADILAQGFIAQGNGEFAVFDRQDLYRAVLNSVEQPRRISEDVLVMDGASFPRFQALIFLMNGSSVIEWRDGQPQTMKTEDTRGWVNGVALEAYQKNIYILSPESAQIYKYERLQDRFSAPVEYNVSGNLAGAVDLAIDVNVYVLKNDGTILKLFRGENQPFRVRNAPDGALKGAAKLFKVTDRNLYVLVPNESGRGGRVVVLSDNTDTGEAVYLRQYIFEGDLVGRVKDLFVDSDESNLYVLDEKRLHVASLAGQ